MIDVLLVFMVSCTVVGIVVVIHYEALYKLTRIFPRVKTKHRQRILLGIFGALIAHSIEVWVFAFAYYFMIRSERWGGLVGEFNNSLLDCMYFSFTTYTTLGFGDIIPHGDIRYLTGVESLTGLVLITWTASFLYLEMQRYWDDR